MGQYHLTVNLDKREFLNPHRFGNGLKLYEQGGAVFGIPTALHLLLAASNGYGGGDYPTGYDDVIGRWAGDRIAIVGDYASPSDLAPEHEADTIYSRCYSAEVDELEAQFDEAVKYRDWESAKVWADMLIRANTPERFTDISNEVAGVIEAVFDVQLQAFC